MEIVKRKHIRYLLRRNRLTGDHRVFSGRWESMYASFQDELTKRKAVADSNWHA